jgi:uncharacterized membrane protein
MTKDEISDRTPELQMNTSVKDGTGFLRRMLWIVFAVSLAGVAFSGTLTYREFSGAAASCPSVGTPGTIFGLPACVFGLVIYVLLAALTGFALMHTRPGDDTGNRATDLAR